MNFVVSSFSNNVFVSVPPQLRGSLCNIKSLEIVLAPQKKTNIIYKEDGQAKTALFDTEVNAGLWSRIVSSSDENGREFVIEKDQKYSRYMKIMHAKKPGSGDIQLSFDGTNYVDLSQNEVTIFFKKL